MPHLNFASVSAMVYDYAEFSCHGVALNVNTESESAYVGEWTKLDRAPANVSSLALVKRGAIYRAFANGEEAQWFYHPSGAVPCNGSAPTAAGAGKRQPTAKSSMTKGHGNTKNTVRA